MLCVLCPVEYQVPRFIDVDPKVLGPLTFRDIMVVMVVGGILALLYFILKPIQFALFALPVGGFALALMFLKINGRPFLIYFKAVLEFMTKPQIFIWKRTEFEREGMEHIFHIVTERSAGTAPGANIAGAPEATTPSYPASPERYAEASDDAQRSKISEIAGQLDENFDAQAA